MLGDLINDAQAVDPVSFAEEAGRKLRGAGAPHWRVRLDRRYSERESAFRWLLDSGPADEGQCLAIALDDFWQHTDRISKSRVA